MAQLIPLAVCEPAGATPIYMGLIVGEAALMLVDCGNPGYWPAIQQAIRETGYDPLALTHLFLTHQDVDHRGSLGDVVAAVPDLAVWCSEADRPAIEGSAPPLRQQLAQQRQATLTGEAAEENARQIQRQASLPTARVARVVSDGDTLSGAAGIRFLAMPGHMPGHMAVYEQASGTVFVGDGLQVKEGRLVAPSERYTLDMAQAMASAKALLALPLTTIICSHGGVVSDHAQEQLRTLVGA